MRVDDNNSGISASSDAYNKDDFQSVDDLSVSDERYNSFLEELSSLIEGSSKDLLVSRISGLHPASIADIVNILSPDERRDFICLLGDCLPGEVLPELEQSLIEEISSYIPDSQLITVLNSLASDDAVYLIDSFAPDRQLELLSKIPAYNRLRLQRSLEYPSDSAGRLLQSDFLAIPEYWSVGRTIDYLRDVRDLPEDFQEVFVIDAGFRLSGVLPLSRLLRSHRPALVKDLMSAASVIIDVQEDREDVGYKFSQYRLISAPVVDDTGYLVGVIRVDDVVDVIEEEVEEDIQLLAGVKDGLIGDGFINTVKSRLSWLIVNLFTAVMASIVISFFEATISRNVALAVLMPIVASMGGNGATQTMTIVVRALARKDLLSYNFPRAVLQEALVGLANGIILSILMCLVTYIWFGSAILALIILAAMILNMVVAGLTGILLPVFLDRLDIDPAVASGVLATTITDVLGFGLFLGFATFFI